MNLFRSVASLLTAQGWLCIVAENGAITQAYFAEEAVNEGEIDTILISALTQLQEYFSGTRTLLELEVNPAGTPFQKKVWEELLKIPFGNTYSYKRFAEGFTAAKSVRAVASAIGANPVAVLIPCHRVVGSNGALTGYAWGLTRKEWLLQHEQGAYAPSLFDEQIIDNERH